MSRVADIPVYAQRPCEIDSTLYNLWRRARLHLPMPMRIHFPDRPGLAVLLEDSEWVCVDELQNDLPLIAWIGFDDQARDALHLPMPCTLNYFHFAASKLRLPTLQLIADVLDNKLHEHTPK